MPGRNVFFAGTVDHDKQRSNTASRAALFIQVRRSWTASLQLVTGQWNAASRHDSAFGRNRRWNSHSGGAVHVLDQGAGQFRYNGNEDIYIRRGNANPRTGSSHGSG